jgi:hypothetical protein
VNKPQVFHIRYYHGGSTAIKERSLGAAEDACVAAAKRSGSTCWLHDAHLEVIGKTVFNKTLGEWAFYHGK